MRRVLVAVLVTISFAGCGTTINVGGYRIHGMSLALCGFHAWRMEHDFRNGHPFYGSFQAWRTIHNCRRAIG